MDSFESVVYTCSHGITPGVAILRFDPQLQPQGRGDLVITDGNITVTIPDMRVDELKMDSDDNGFVSAIRLVDRRWKWRELGGIFCDANQLDPFGHLIPWTVRSPRE